MLTQTMYGMSRHPAIYESLKNLIQVISIEIQSNKITMTPAIGDLSPKKTIDHKALRISCSKNITRAGFTPLLFNPLRHTRKAAIPIRR